MTPPGDVRPSTMDIHRLLDDAFAGIEPTPAAQDLKEEMRGDLMVRVAELESGGIEPAEAARRALRELGDIRSIVDELHEVVGPGRPPGYDRVRPRPAFVVRTVVIAIVGAAALAVVTLAAFGRDIAPAGLFTAGAVVALAAGVLVADGLRQETTGNYPLTRARAVGFGVATTAALAGIGTGAWYLRDPAVPWLVTGGLIALGAVIGFTYLGATQTNRHKPWLVRLAAEHSQAGDRFSQDPVAAARFGMYTVIIWTVTLAAFAVLTIAVGWAWSWLALVGGLVVFLLTLARMLFVPPARP